MKTLKEKYNALRKEDFSNDIIQLAILKEYKKERESRYTIRYIDTGSNLKKKLNNIVKNQIDKSDSFEEYRMDGPENEPDEIKGLKYEETDYFKIHNELLVSHPNDQKISGLDELLKAKAYLIIIREKGTIKAVGFKTLPENWKMKKTKGLIPLLFKDNKFIDLKDEEIFNISNSVDFIFYQDALFVLCKKNFEAGLNFRKGMEKKAEGFYNTVLASGLVANIEILKQLVGNNQRYLRKIAIIENLSLYKDPEFIKDLELIAKKRKWKITIKKGVFILDNENVELFLTLLQNKRLYSEITQETFDVDSAKKVL